VDGDRYEEANRSRVLFKSLDNKAISLSAELSTLTEGAVAIVPVPRFVSPANVHRLVGERDVVFLAVDNHATRRCVSNRCRRLAEVLLISGGNDGLEDNRSGTFGNVMVYLRKRSRDQTSPLSRFHPEIARPQDKRPDELSCEELARAGAPQLLFTNLAVAAAMLQPFYGWLSRSLDYEELCLDIGKGRMTPVRRSARRVKRKL
jgi:molybdopterin/thiamine biosynthesis adenylyltransferase